MLLNNLDPRGRRAARGARRLRRLGQGRARPRRAARDRARAARRSATTRRCSSRAASRSACCAPGRRAPRVLIANSLLVPRWATWDEFRRLEAEGLTMFGQMTAGSWIYIGTQGILQGTYQTFAAAGERHFGSADLGGRTILTAGLGGMGGAQPLAATMAGAAILCVEVDPARIRAAPRDALPRRGDRLARRGARARARGCRGEGGRSRSDCSATPPRSCRSSRAAGRRSTSSPTRPPRTTRSPATCPAGSRSTRLPRCGRRIRTSTSGARASRSPATSRGCSSTSGAAAMFSTMATTSEGRRMRQA